MWQKLELEGTVFGEWYVVGDSGERKPWGTVMWLCECSCGVLSLVDTGNLRSGRSTRCDACGSKKAGRTLTTHGECNSHLYNVWQRVNSDCVDEWKEYIAFKNCVEPRTDRFLVKIHSELPFGPQNFIWSVGYGRVLSEGGFVETVRGLAKKIGVSKQAINQAKSRGSLHKVIENRAHSIKK